MKSPIKDRNIDYFKLSLIIFLLFITLYQISAVIRFSYNVENVISDKVILGVALVLLIAYLFMEEFRNQQIIQKSYVKLVAIQQRLRETNLDAIRSLVLAEEAKDPYTSGHSARVAKYSCLIARKLGFPKEDIRVLENAGILHDIGKMGISDMVLHKKGKLNSEEWKVIKRHPDMAVDILSPLEFLSQEREIIKHHHERYDGKGYPDNIKANEIPIGSKILAVADALDAMRSNRPYRAPLPEEKVISELKDCAGTMFDPQIVEVLLTVINEQTDIL